MGTPYVTYIYPTFIVDWEEAEATFLSRKDLSSSSGNSKTMKRQGYAKTKFELLK